MRILDYVLTISNTGKNCYRTMNKCGGTWVQWQRNNKLVNPGNGVLFE